MKAGFILIALSLAVSACGRPEAAAWYQRKAQCVDGDYAACAEIGHQARAAKGGATLERDTRFQPLSTPIID